MPVFFAVLKSAEAVYAHAVALWMHLACRGGLQLRMSNKPYEELNKREDEAE